MLIFSLNCCRRAPCLCPRQGKSEDAGDAEDDAWLVQDTVTVTERRGEPQAPAPTPPRWRLRIRQAREYRTRFLNLLRETTRPAPAGELGAAGSEDSRPPKSIVWVVRTIRGVYDDKLAAEAADLREGIQSAAMPEYAVEWMAQRYGVRGLVNQVCRDLYYSTQLYRPYSLEVDMFARFLGEYYTAEELSFHLYSRAMTLDKLGDSCACATVAPALVA